MLIGSHSPLTVVDEVPAELRNQKAVSGHLILWNTQDWTAGPDRIFLYVFGLSVRMPLLGEKTLTIAGTCLCILLPRREFCNGKVMK